MSSEHEIQKAFFTCLAYQFPKIRKVAHAIPNGGSRNKIEAARLKMAGVTAGIPDIFIPIPNKVSHGLYIEFKKHGGRLTKAQEEMIERLKGYGYQVNVCYSWYEARDVVKEYLRGEEND